MPLNSRNPLVNTLWRLGLSDEAWDHWRSDNDPATQRPPSEQLVEGRLRLAIDDPWTALGRLWRQAFAGAHQAAISRSSWSKRNRPFFSGMNFCISQESTASAGTTPGSDETGIPFHTNGELGCGRQGLMQLMPATADELAGRTLEQKELNDPAFNIELGATYLRQLLKIWQNNPLLAIASYNAGPGAVNGWLTDELNHSPELWVERIPYPETRYYTKKVMDNVLRYSAKYPNRCEQPGSRDQVSDPDSSEQDG